VALVQEDMVVGTETWMDTTDSTSSSMMTRSALPFGAWLQPEIIPCSRRFGVRMSDYKR
jgi:hypothetical protein